MLQLSALIGISSYIRFQDNLVWKTVNFINKCSLTQEQHLHDLLSPGNGQRPYTTISLVMTWSFSALDICTRHFLLVWPPGSQSICYWHTHTYLWQQTTCVFLLITLNSLYWQSSTVLLSNSREAFKHITLLKDTMKIISFVWIKKRKT